MQRHVVSRHHGDWPLDAHPATCRRVSPCRRVPGRNLPASLRAQDLLRSCGCCRQVVTARCGGSAGWLHLSQHWRWARPGTAQWQLARPPDAPGCQHARRALDLTQPNPLSCGRAELKTRRLTDFPVLTATRCCFLGRHPHRKEHQARNVRGCTFSLCGPLVWCPLAAAHACALHAVARAGTRGSQ